MNYENTNNNILNLALLVKNQVLSAEMAIFLSEAYRSRVNIAVIGGTYHGKTTVVKALMNEAPNSRNIVIGDMREYSENSGNLKFVLIDPEVTYRHDFNKSFEDAASLRPDRVIFDYNSGRGKFANKGFSLINDSGIHLLSTFHANETSPNFWERDTYPFELEVRIKRQDLPNDHTKFVISSIDQVTKNFGQIINRRLFSRVNGVYFKKEDATRPLRRKISQGLRYAELNPGTQEEISGFIAKNQRTPVQPLAARKPLVIPEKNTESLSVKEEIQQHLDAISELLKKL